jgi:tetratricopeptide (TPR) repeat protein
LNFTGIGILLVFSLVTWNRTKVWADSVALWTDVMEKNPKCLSAYVNRSYMYIQYKQYDKAIKDCDEGLKIDSNHYKLYINRGTAYRDMAVYDLALENFSAAIRKNPKSYDTYLDRGILYTDHFNKLDSGVSDFRYYQLFRPDEKNGNYNLGVAYYKKQNYDSALYFCKRTLEIAPDYAGAYFVSALVYAVKQDFVKAYEHGSRAQALGFGIDQAMLDGWRKNANIVMPDLR